MYNRKMFRIDIENLLSNNPSREDLISLAKEWKGNIGFNEETTSTENIISLILDSLNI